MPVTCPVFAAAHYFDLCRSIDHYCERTSPALDSEPINASTNVAFLIASAAAWFLFYRRSPPYNRRLIQALILIIAIIGLGSFVFHTLGTRWAEWADVLPILLFIIIYVWLILTTYFGWSSWLKLVAVSLLFSATLYLEARAPQRFFWGGAFYFPAVLTMIVISISLWRTNATAGRAIAFASVVFFLSLAARTLDMPLCDFWPQGTHFLWHLLNAAVLYLLVRVPILHGPSPMRRRTLW